MVTEEQARQLILAAGEGTPLVIMSCELSERGDFWVIVANTEDYVSHGKLEAMLLGVNAYLVHVGTGAITVVGSAQRWEDVIEGLHDLEVAAGQFYVLVSTGDQDDKRETIRLHQRLACSLRDARYLLSPAGQHWLTGTRRALAAAQALLHAQGIATEVVLRPDAGGAIVLESAEVTWPVVSEHICRRAAHCPRLDSTVGTDSEQHESSQGALGLA